MPPILAFLLAGALGGSSFANDSETLPLQGGEIVFFLGITGDFTDGKERDVESALSSTFDLDLLGGPVRSLTSRERLVWAVQCSSDEDPGKMIRRLVRPLKKNGYKPSRVKATVLTPTGRALSASLRTAARKVERDNPKVWGTFLSSKHNVLWVFHDPKLTGKKVLEGIREGKVKVSFHHQELEVKPLSQPAPGGSEGGALSQIEKRAKTELDLVGAQMREGVLILDVYLRDLNHLLSLKKGKKVLLCPDVVPGVYGDDVDTSNASWELTFDVGGYPFQG
ncbi:MAG TPA: hypothetical protein DDW23_06625 [Planctomycetes bacterium]|nr:hypothetical protein [Planctomycetota bacterium]